MLVCNVRDKIFMILTERNSRLPHGIHVISGWYAICYALYDRALKNKRHTMQNSLFYPSKKAQWTSTRWKKAEDIIAKLQHRIAKAALEGKKICNLQRLLVKSLSARLKAVRQVAQENKRKNTPGIDGELWTTPRLKLEAAFLFHKRSKTKPLRRISIPKKDGSARPLGIPVMSDRACQALWNLSLLPVVESTYDPVSYGFRPFRGLKRGCPRTNPSRFFP